MLLGYMEQTQIYNSINFTLVNRDLGSGAMANTPSIAIRRSTFFCPSPPLPVGSQESGRPFPGNNYFASVGPSLEWGEWQGSNAPTGIFRGTGFPNQPTWKSNGGAIGLRDITDGSSNTIAFGEWRTGDNDSNKLSLPQDIIGRVPYTGTAGTNFPGGGQANFQTWITQCAGAAKASVGQWQTNYSGMANNWDQGMYGYAFGNTLLAPNPPYPNCRTCTWDGDLDCAGMYGLSSFHPGGGNVLLGDGSVRFLKSSTNTLTIWALGTRAGGEVLSADSY